MSPSLSLLALASSTTTAPSPAASQAVIARGERPPLALDVSAAAIALPSEAVEVGTEAVMEAVTEAAGAVRRQLKGAGDSGWKPGFVTR